METANKYLFSSDHNNILPGETILFVVEVGLFPVHPGLLPVVAGLLVVEAGLLSVETGLPVVEVGLLVVETGLFPVEVGLPGDETCERVDFDRKRGKYQLFLFIQNPDLKSG